jgi:hypothetical protein
MSVAALMASWFFPKDVRLQKSKMEDLRKRGFKHVGGWCCVFTISVILEIIPKMKPGFKTKVFRPFTFH